MKTVLLYIIISLALIEAGYIYLLKTNSIPDESLQAILPIEKPLEEYSFANLRKTSFPSTDIILGEEVSETASSTARLFYFSTPTTPQSTGTKKVSGLINIPKGPGTYPVIVMFRGYVPAEIYKPGMGTQPSASVFSQQRFITLAPDFLGYGESDKPSTNSFEDRFETYTTALSLLASITNLNSALEKEFAGQVKAESNHINLWGHSNGGHIALATLAITGQNYPTVLWAPVSKSFPYSILYYTDEYDDQGKTTRKALSDFEKLYDTQVFSPPRYYRFITAPIALFQGRNDQEVLPWWSAELAKKLREDYELDIEYTEYPNADHNLQPDGWNDAVSRSMSFYRTHILP